MENREGKMNKISIKLSKGYDLDDRMIGEVELREPTVKDVLQATKTAGNSSQEERDVILVSNLCNVPVDFIEKLSFKDYKVISEELKTFL